jgi:methionine sulfoxide reductase heme-binding subunit
MAKRGGDLMTDALWYLARGTGLVSLAMLTVVVVLGVGSRAGRPVFGLPRFAVALVHRNASLLAVSLLAVHVTTLLFDPYAQLGVADTVIPFRGSYRPLWVGLGTLAFDLVIALVITSLLRQRLGLRVWRAVHWLAYVAWPIAWLHAWNSGTDSGSAWLRLSALACSLLFGAALVWRFSAGFSENAGIRRTPGRVGPSAPAPVRMQVRR